MTFRLRGRAVMARLAVAVAAAGTVATLATAPGQAASAAGAGPVSVQTVVIPVAGQQPVQAYLVQPAGALASSSQAGILFLHWLGQIHSDRSEFLAEAIELAGHGAVSLLPQAPQGLADAIQNITSPAAGRQRGRITIGRSNSERDDRISDAPRARCDQTDSSDR